jgi:hypothetical protein
VVEVMNANGGNLTQVSLTGMGVYNVCWGPDNQSVIYETGGNLLVKVQADGSGSVTLATGVVISSADWVYGH